MEIQRIASLYYEQIRNAGIVLYSLLVMATVLPGVHFVPGVVLMPYYLLVPGYCATTLLGKSKGFVELLFFSVCWSLAIIASVIAINSLGLASLPLNVAVPVITVFILALVHLTSRR